jgi:hypothetical protein
MHEAYTAALCKPPARCAMSSVSCKPKFSLVMSHGDVGPFVLSSR